MASRQPTRTRFARALLSMGSGASSWLIVAFVLGVIALGVFSNLVFTMALELGGGRWLGWAVVLFVLAILIGLAYAAYRYDLAVAWRAGSLDAEFDEKQVAPPHKGLIWLLSRGNLDLPLIAIRHHHAAEGAAGHLGHCWVVLTPGSQELYEQLKARVEEVGFDVLLHPVQLEAVTIEATYRAIDGIYAKKAGEVNLTADDIIADLTGGLKTMTAGMVMACLPHGRALEYIESARDPATGEPVTGTQIPVVVGVEFKAAA